MKNKVAVKKVIPSSITKKLIEALMVKTGIKAGPEITITSH